MKVSRKTLKNGLRVVAVPVEDAMTVTVLIMVEAGSKYEDKRINGLSHFLEHMCFKGTTRRPRSIDITHELDSIGSDYNAFTTQEFTAYYVKSHPKHLAKVLDIVADLYMDPVFDEKEIEKEKGVVIEEINMYEDTPMEQIGDTFQTVLYGDQPAGRPILGTKEGIRALTRDDLVEYRNAHYVAEATTVVVAGNFDEKHVFGEVARIFEGMNDGRKKGKVKVKDAQAEERLFFKSKDSEQAHVALGVRAFPVNDERGFAIRVLNSVLGGGMSSRLWQKLREEMGVAYYAYPYFKPYTDHGFFSVFAGVDSSRVPEAVSAIMDEFRRLKREPVSDAELKKAKDYLLGQIYLGLESSDEIAIYYGRQEILRQGLMKPKELSDRIRKVTAAEVQGIAKDLFVNRKLNFVLIGKYADETAVRPLLRF